MRSLCIVLALLGQFQLEELQVTEVYELPDLTFVQEELKIPVWIPDPVEPVKIEEPAEPEPPKQEVKVEVDSRPVFDLLGATWCGGCNTLERSLKRLDPKDLPFIVRHHNVDSKGWLGASSIPAWVYNGRIIQYGFSTPENLMSNFRKITQSQVTNKPSGKTLQRLSPAQLKAFAHSYRGPDVGVRGGNFWYHLQEGNHGFTASQLNGLTQWECARIHGAHHYRYLTPFSIGGK